MKNKHHLLSILTLLNAIFYTSHAIGELSQVDPAPFEKENSTNNSLSLGERFENLGRIYKDDNNSLVQEFWLLGRYHGHYHSTESSESKDDGWEDRRFRIGAQGKFFKKLTLHAQMVSGSDKY